MNYNQQEINMLGAIFDNESVHMYIRPSLPTFEFDYGEWHVTASDIRCLNENAIRVFEACINYCIDGEDKATFTVTKEMSDDQLQIIIDIVTGIKYSARTGDEDDIESVGVDSGTLLVTSSITKWTDEDDKVITFYFDDMSAEAIRRVADEGDGNVNYVDVVKAVLDEHNTYFAKWLKEQSEAHHAES